MVSTPTAATTATTTTARRRAQKTVVANDGQDDDGMSATGGTAAAKSRSRRAQASGTSSRRGAGAAAAAAAAAAAYSEEEEEAEDDDDDDGQGGGQLGDGGAGAGDDADGDAKVYCTCRGPSHGEMIGCDDDECPFEWVSSGGPGSLGVFLVADVTARFSSTSTVWTWPSRRRRTANGIATPAQTAASSRSRGARSRRRPGADVDYFAPRLAL